MISFDVIRFLSVNTIRELKRSNRKYNVLMPKKFVRLCNSALMRKRTKIKNKLALIEFYLGKKISLAEKIVAHILLQYV